LLPLAEAADCSPSLQSIQVQAVSLNSYVNGKLLGVPGIPITITGPGYEQGITVATGTIEHPNTVQLQVGKTYTVKAPHTWKTSDGTSYTIFINSGITFTVPEKPDKQQAIGVIASRDTDESPSFVMIIQSMDEQRMPVITTSIKIEITTADG